MAKPKNRKHQDKSGYQRPLADSADRHALYEESVQSVESEIEFLRDTFRSVRGRPAVSLREDFCGTAAAACEWVKDDPMHTAIGIDIDPEVLGWGRDNNVARLSAEDRMRLRLVQADVFDADVEKVDIAVAFNFSYWLFKDRENLRNYFETVRKGLKEDGLFIVDAFGGSEALDEMEEETEHDGFSYIWDQSSFDPVTHDMTCHIHFKFPDGSRIKRAFSYHWRLWTLPEIQEVLTEAGYSNVTVWWDQSDDDDDSDYEPVAKGEADPAWIAYIVAEK